MIRLSNITYAWTPDRPVLSIDMLEIGTGEKVFIQGASGSGKSTLLNLISGVFTPTSGSIEIAGQAFGALSSSKRDRIRADCMGVIFQQFNLVPFLSLEENVLLPARFSKARRARIGTSESDRRDRAHAMLDRLGLGIEARDGRAVTDLSVGQQQRVAAARALIGEPTLVIADEPTSALDHNARDIFIETLLAEAKDATVLFVSHDPTLAAHFDRAIDMGNLNEAVSVQALAQTGEAV